MKRFLLFLLYSLLTGLFFYVMQFGLVVPKASIPPLGKFLSPFTGFWSNAENTGYKPPASLKIQGLQQPVEIIYDDRMVPHIFAQNDHDLFFAQGYVTAQMRLWQMEFQTHFAAGRVSEIIGSKTLDLDRSMRRKGLPYAAELAVKQLENDPATKQILDAYTNGVNAWISQLDYRNYPLEYKLLNYQPEPWSNFKSALLLKYMADMLTGKSYDIEYSNAIALVGEDQIGLLYPDFPDSNGTSPIVPVGTIFTPSHFDLDTPTTAGIYNHIPIVPETAPKNIGSNNWAVNGKKTQSGYPILCNDPHLGLNLPSIWFEIQLATPEFNSYGVSLPGAPCIVIGFNNDIAWGVTNGTQDVMDWYKVKFKDAGKQEYWFDGEWRKTELRVESIKIKGEKTFLDTVYYTHYGPVVYDASLTKDTSALNLAISWTGLEPSNEMITFYKLNRAHNYGEYVEAIKTFQCPGQNFIFASHSGDIAIWQQGKFPLKWPQQGKFVMDGSSSIYQWQGYIPQEENPHVLNPERNFVSSANQHPTDSSYPYYYNGAFEYYRNRRINERLAAMDNIMVEDMMKLQSDNLNLQATECLPILLQNIDKDKLTAEGKTYLAELEKWNYQNEAGSIAAAVFEEWMLGVENYTWDELLVPNMFTDYPMEYTLFQIMKKYPEHEIFDIRSTPDKTENLRSVINLAFSSACDNLNKWKSSHTNALTWSAYKNTTLRHLTRLPQLSVSNIECGGNRKIVNATNSNWGPSWRMVVSMEKPVRAFGVYPGGQSGNPGSPYYLTGLEKWRTGQYFELLFLQSSTEKNPRIVLKQTLTQ